MNGRARQALTGQEQLVVMMSPRVPAVPASRCICRARRDARFEAGLRTCRGIAPTPSRALAQWLCCRTRFCLPLRGQCRIHTGFPILRRFLTQCVQGAGTSKGRHIDVAEARRQTAPGRKVQARAWLTKRYPTKPTRPTTTAIWTSAQNPGRSLQTLFMPQLLQGFKGVPP